MDNEENDSNEKNKKNASKSYNSIEPSFQHSSNYLYGSNISDNKIEQHNYSGK